MSTRAVFCAKFLKDGQSPSCCTWERTDLGPVNVLKKVKGEGRWKLCPVIVEPGGKLKDRVQVNGRAEVHNEGVYYIEWRANNRRLRQSVPNRNHVLERARLKALELNARKAGIQMDEKLSPSPSAAGIARSEQ